MPSESALSGTPVGGAGPTSTPGAFNAWTGCGCCGDNHSCPIIICVEACDGTPLVGVLVTIKNGTTTITSCVTHIGADGKACCGVDIGDPGTYTIEVGGGAGCFSYKRRRKFECNTKYTIKIKCTTPTVTFIVTGCCGDPLPDATVTFDGVEYTTDADGKAFIGVTDPGTYSWTIHKNRFTDVTGTETLTSCQANANISRLLSPDSGYHCGPKTSGPNPDPVPNTLVLTDTVWGGTFLTYSPTLFGGPGWNGHLTVAFPGICAFCPPANVTISYRVSPCTVTTTIPLSVTWPRRPGHGNCPDDLFAAGTSVANLTSQTVDPGMPLNLSATITAPANPCLPFPVNIGTTMYPAGATITVTE